MRIFLITTFLMFAHIIYANNPTSTPYSENIIIVKKYFQSLSDNDLEKTLSMINDDAIWTITGANNVPTVGEWKGKSNITRFIKALSESFIVIDFNIQHYFTNEDSVFAIGNFSHRIKATNKMASSRFMIEFKVKDQKISSYAMLEDSYGFYQAFLPN